MNPIEFLESFPLITSNEGFFDFVSGKSKPKDNIEAKDIKNILKKTYGNPEWLAKFKTPSGKVKVKWDNHTSVDPVKGFDEHVKSVKALQRHVLEGLEKIKKVVEPIRKATNHDQEEKLEEDLSKLIKEYTPPESTTYTEREPIPKEAIPELLKYLLAPTKPMDTTGVKTLDKIDEYNANWYNVNAPYRKELEARDEELGTYAIIIRGYLVEYSRLFDESDFIVSHRHYKESLIRHINASLV